MANGKIRFGKQSGGQLAFVIPDGVTSTDLVLPESGTVATEAYADGKTTMTQVKAEISTGSNLVTSPAGVIGYGAGAGGIVTQLTNKGTNVTLNKPTGKIITSNSALAANSSVGFYLDNSLITTDGNIIVTIVAGDNSGNSYGINVSSSPLGRVLLYITNKTGASRSESLTIKFDLINGAIS